MASKTKRANWPRYMGGQASVSWLALLVAMGSAGFAYWAFEYRVDAHPVTDKPVQSAGGGALNGEIMTRLARLEDQLPAFKAASDNALASVAELRNQRDQLRRLLDQTLQDSAQMALLDVELLVTQADQALIGSTDFAAPIYLLGAARQRVALVGEGGLEPLASALDADRNRLLELSRRSITLATSQLDQLAREAGMLKLRGEGDATTPAAPGNQKSESAEPGYWQRVIKSTEELVSLPGLPATTVARREFLIETLRLRLLSARLSLMLHDRAGFEADRTRCIGLLREFFETDDSAVSQALATLEELSPLGTAQPAASVQQSLEALKALRTAPDTPASGDRS